MKISVYVATSIDGYIARANGDVDWLNIEQVDPKEDYGYKDFIASVDLLVMGRGCFEKVLSFGVDWPYEGTQVVVLSSKEIDIPAELQGKVLWQKGAPSELAKEWEAQDVQHIYLDGGMTIKGFLEAGLIDEWIVTQIPVVLGVGIPLFPKVDKDLPLKLRKSQAYSSGMVQNHFVSVKSQ